jgi:hypothetical protein
VSLKQLFQRLNGGRLLGLDVGSRNIGVAVSDPQCRIASPHSVLYRTQSTMLKNISRLETLVSCASFFATRSKSDLLCSFLYFLQMPGKWALVLVDIHLVERFTKFH